MNSKTNTARKTVLAAAIALAAAAPAFAASAPSEWAGYPSGDSVQFQAQPASLSTTAEIAIASPEAQTQTADRSYGTSYTPAAVPVDANTAQADASTSLAADDSATMIVSQTTWTVVPLTAAAADTTPATLPQWEQPAITRESVRAELLAAREAGTLTPQSEVGDTDRVLAARQAFNEEQTAAIVAEYQAEYDRQVAMQEAEIRRAAIEAEWLQYGSAQNPSSYDDPTAEVQIDVISMEPLGVGE